MLKIEFLLSSILLSFIQGIINALDVATRQAFLPEMVDNKADLDNAIALNASLLGLSRLIGSAIAGIIIANFGIGICFLVDGISYIAVLASLFAMKIRHKAFTTPFDYRLNTVKQPEINYIFTISKISFSKGDRRLAR